MLKVYSFLLCFSFSVVAAAQPVGASPKYELKRPPWDFPDAVEAPMDHPLKPQHCPGEKQILMLSKDGSVLGCDVLLLFPKVDPKMGRTKVVTNPDGSNSTIIESLDGQMSVTAAESAEIVRKMEAEQEKVTRAMGGRTLPPREFDVRDAYRLHGRRNYKRRVSKGWNPNSTAGENGKKSNQIYTVYGEIVPTKPLTTQDEELIKKRIKRVYSLPMPLSKEEKALGITIPEEYYKLHGNPPDNDDYIYGVETYGEPLKDVHKLRLR
jgi:hypothetical protein